MNRFAIGAYFAEQRGLPQDLNKISLKYNHVLYYLHAQGAPLSHLPNSEAS
jgi:hypothetical protein